MVIEVNKDIDRYQESVAMGLTARQLIFSIASVVVGGSIVLLLYKYIGLTGSAYVAIPCVAPIALGGFYSFNGMNFYEYMGKKLHFMFGNRAFTYVSTEGEPACAFLLYWLLSMPYLHLCRLIPSPSRHLPLTS